MFNCDKYSWTVFHYNCHIITTNDKIKPNQIMFKIQYYLYMFMHTYVYIYIYIYIV